ncbi:MAG TPA: hypothetical protein VGM13_00010 [Thermoanaerobaculia bacterium]
MSARVNRARDLESLYRDGLDALEEVFRFRHSIVFLADEKAGKLVAIASHGYGESGIGAEIRMGEGLVGYVAAKRVPIRLSGMDELLRYGRAVRGRVEVAGDAAGLTAEIPLPGLPDAESQLPPSRVPRRRLPKARRARSSTSGTTTASSWTASTSSATFPRRSSGSC